MGVAILLSYSQKMNVINAVLAAPSPATASQQQQQLGAAATVRSNGHHNSSITTSAASATANEGYNQLTGQGSSSSCSSSESEDHRHRHSTTKPPFPREESPSSSSASCSSSSRLFRDDVTDKTDCQYSPRDYSSPSTSSKCLSSQSNTSSSSLNLSNPNINAVHFPCDEFEGDYLYAVHSLEHDLDCILENRDLNPFYEDFAMAGGSKDDRRRDSQATVDENYDGASCDFNVEDFLVDLDEYLNEQDRETVAAGTLNPSTTLDRRILRKPNTNRTLPRSLGAKNLVLQRNAALRSSVHLLGKEEQQQPTGGEWII